MGYYILNGKLKNCVHYCNKCGYIGRLIAAPKYIGNPGWEKKWAKDKLSKCYCGNIRTLIDDEFLIQQFIDSYGSSKIEKLIREKYISQPLDQEAIEARNQELTNRVNAINDRIEKRQMMYGTPSIPKCPTCGSTNLSKISFTKKIVKTSLFGVLGAVDDAGKTYKCGNCGCKF